MSVLGPRTLRNYGKVQLFSCCIDHFNYTITHWGASTVWHWFERGCFSVLLDFLLAF